MNRNFLLSGPVGSFPLPPGESRVGSDAACEICIRGDGILPVHAYLRADGDKILIRPASGDAVADASRAPIAVEGSLITGPATVLSGQSLAIGPVQLRLQRAALPRRSFWSRKWFRITTYSVAGTVVLALGLALYVRYVFFGDESIKSWIREGAYEYLGRDRNELEFGAIDVHLLDGYVLCKDVRLRERVEFQSASPQHFIQIPSLKIKMDFVGYLTSWKKRVHNLEVSAYAMAGQTPATPEIVIERSAVDGSFSIEDILQRLTTLQRKTRDVALTHLDFKLNIDKARITLHDPFTRIGDTILEDFSLGVRMDGPGQPLLIEKCEMAVNSSPPPLEKGSVKLAGRIYAVDENSPLDLSKISSTFAIEAEKFDLARLFEHFGYAWEPQGATFKVVLGKPIKCKLDIATRPRDISVKGNVTSDSLISIKEDKQPPLGNFPMRLDVTDLHLVKSTKNGAPFVPESLNVTLESWTDAARFGPPFLSFNSHGQMNKDGTSSYHVDISCGMQQLVNTDVGKRLKLDGALGGVLTGKADLIVEPNNILSVKAEFRGKDTYVMVPEPDDSEPPHRRGMVKQPLPLSFDFIGNAKRDSNGEFEYIDVGQFALEASSFKAVSEAASRIDFKRKDERMSAEAQFGLTLNGRDFCREFSPILALFGFNKPLEEEFVLKVGVYGRQDIIAIGATGKASRQWAKDPAPVNLTLSMEYNRPRLLQPRGDFPWLSMSVVTESSGDKPLNVKLEAHCTQRDGCDAIELVSLDKAGKDTGKPGLIIDTELAAFTNRFGPYVELLLQPLGKDPKAGALLTLYRGAELSGQVHQEGRIKVKRVHNEARNKTDHIAYELNTTADFKAALTPEAVAVIRNDPKAKDRFEWSEPKLTLSFAGTYVQCLGITPEEPDKLRMLNLDRLKVEGSLGQFTVSVRDLDLLALGGIRNSATKTWTDAVDGLNIAGTISPQAAVLLKSLRVIDPADPVSGTLDLEVAFDRKSDALDLKKFDFKQSGGFYVTRLNASGALAKVRGISAKLFPTKPNDSTLAERIAAWLDESGPAALFQHLGKELTINTVEVDAKPFREWLGKTFKADGRRPPALFAGVLDQTWEPQGIWRASPLSLVRDPNYPDTWRLNGVFQSDLTAPFFEQEVGLVPVLTLGRHWKVALGLSLNRDNAAAMHGELILDDAELHATLPALKIELDKPAGEPLKIELEGCAAMRGLLPTSIGRLHATGKFGDFELQNFISPEERTGLQFQVEKFKLKSAPLTCSGSIANFDLNADKLDARAEAPVLEMRGLPEVWALAPPNSRGVERLKNVTFAYKGGIVSLLASLPPSFKPSLTETDPRRNGVQPANDVLALEGDLEGLAVDLTKTDTVKFGGRILASANEMNCKNFTADIWRYEPGGTGTEVAKATLVQRFSIPKLRVRSIDSRLNIREAAGLRGIPLELSGEVECERRLDSAHLASVRDAWKIIAPKTAAAATDLLAASKLTVIASLKAPELAIDPVAVANFDLRNATLKDLKLTVPVLTASYLGGRLKLEDAEYDFSKLAAKGEMKGLRHTQRINFSDLDLCTLLCGGKPDPVRYALCGKFGSVGNFSGIDFSAADRLSWNGVMQLDIANFSVGAPLAERGNTVPLPWMESFKNHSAARATLLSRASLSDSISPLALSMSGIPCTNGSSVVDGLLACTELYLAKVYGVETPRFEFEQIKPTVRFEKGLAVFEPIELKGKGTCAGLDLHVRNLKINLADERLAEEVLIFPVSLPQSAQDRLALAKWEPVARKAFQALMADGKLPLRISGPFAAPTVKFPWMETRALARKSLFGIEAITDMESLAKAREHLLTLWGKDDASLAAAALFADRYGAGLPGTLSARMSRDTVVDNAQKLPPKIHEALALTPNEKLPALSPLDSLKTLLFAEHPAPPPPPPPVLPPVEPQKEPPKKSKEKPPKENDPNK